MQRRRPLEVEHRRAAAAAPRARGPRRKTWRRRSAPLFLYCGKAPVSFPVVGFGVHHTDREMEQQANEIVRPLGGKAERRNTGSKKKKARRRTTWSKDPSLCFSFVCSTISIDLNPRNPHPFRFACDTRSFSLFCVWLLLCGSPRRARSTGPTGARLRLCLAHTCFCSYTTYTQIHDLILMKHIPTNR